jgi:hypothetical protein
LKSHLKVIVGFSSNAESASLLHPINKRIIEPAVLQPYQIAAFDLFKNMGMSDIIHQAFIVTLLAIMTIKMSQMCDKSLVCRQNSVGLQKEESKVKSA